MPKTYFRMVDFDELKEFVFSLPNKGSPDDVSSEFIKNTFENIKEPLLNLINSSIETGKVPTLLKVSTIIPIEKTKGAVKADDFRPVNMLSTTEKILEKVVNKQLLEFINLNIILIENQSGFRKHHSCETTMQNILHDWKLLLDDYYAIGAVFLDLRRAFETLNRQKLIQKLRAYGIVNKALDWLVDYLDNRRQVTRINDELSTEIVNQNGDPQGSTLGPLPFLLYINDINKVVNHGSIQLFAEETLIYFHSKDLKHLMQTMNIELDKVSNWFNGNSLKLNIKKNKFMLLGNSRCQKEFEETKLSIMIKTEMIETVKNIKYLGFIVDNNLNFKEHILYIIEKLTKNIIFFSRVSVHLTQWSKITVYNTLIMPHLLFSASILYLANKNEIKRLKKLQNRVMRIILKEKRDIFVAYQTKGRKCQKLNFTGELLKEKTYTYIIYFL